MNIEELYTTYDEAHTQTVVVKLPSGDFEVPVGVAY